MEEKVVSSFFSGSSNFRHTIDYEEDSISEDFLHIIDELNISLEQYPMPKKVKCVYNPTLYARHTFEMYVRKYCNRRKPIMYFGMNPGPWGMSQTGVPFGEISSVRDWLGIQGPVNKPPQELNSRPIKGFECTRVEVSGKRFWGLFKQLCTTPDNFFNTSFVYNYLPQQWMKDNGCNVTPNECNAAEVRKLYDICDPVFHKVVELYQVETIVAVGEFCETRAKKTLERYSCPRPIQIIRLPHPSPRALNNNNWDVKAIDFLKKYNLLQYYQGAATT